MPQMDNTIELNKSKRTALAVATDGFRFILPVLFLTIASALAFLLYPGQDSLGYLTLFLMVLTAYMIYFFRDPERRPPNIEGAIVSPADGKVTQIDEVEHSGFPEGKAKRVSVFLSIFNVHVNRAPIEGEIGEIKYFPGKFLNAMADKSSDENEHNIVEIKNSCCRVYVKQIAGLIARRIVCYMGSGDDIEHGGRIGLIRFGSRVDTFFPLHAEVCVKKGTIVKGGESVLAVLENPLHKKEQNI